MVSKQANARDARVSLVRLSNVGAEILNDATASFKLATQAVFEDLTQADLDGLAKTMARLK